MEKLQMEQEKILKTTIRELERANNREASANLEYLKNVVIKYILTGEHEVQITCPFSILSFQALLPVLSQVLQFSPEEMQAVRNKIAANSSGYGLWGLTSSVFSPKK